MPFLLTVKAAQLQAENDTGSGECGPGARC